MYILSDIDRFAQAFRQMEWVGQIQGIDSIGSVGNIDSIDSVDRIDRQILGRQADRSIQ